MFHSILINKYLLLIDHLIDTIKNSIINFYKCIRINIFQYKKATF